MNRGLVVLALVASLLIWEVVLRTQKGLPLQKELSSLELDSQQAAYMYQEIYKRFFRKARLTNGQIVYQAQRNRSRAEPFPVDRARNKRRIFVLGGSVADGLFWNQDKTILEALLQKALPAQEFEIINCGMEGYDSYRASLIHQEVLSYSPDFIILLSGNNEAVPEAINPWVYRFNKLFCNLWLYRKAQQRFISWRISHGLNNEISEQDQLLNYEKNLKVMIKRAKKKKVPMFLCTLPANFRDCPPGYSAHKFDKQFFLARQALTKKEFRQAASRFERFVNDYPQDASGHYFLAQCYEGLRDYAQAQKYYLNALDMDGLDGRCPPQLNELIRKLCLQEGVILVDLERAFIAAAPHGLVGKELFSDNCHWYKEYNFLAWEAIGRVIIEYERPHLKSVYSSKGKSNAASKIEDFVANQPEVLKDRAFRNALYAIGVLPTDFERDLISERCLSFFKTAYQLDPELFSDTSSLKEQLIQGLLTNWWWQDKLSYLEQRWPTVLCHIAEAFYREQMYFKAIEYLNQAIRLNGDVSYAYLTRGLVYYEMGEIDQAKKNFAKIDKQACCYPLVQLYRQSLGI